DFLIWLFLVLAKVLNFDFGLNPAIFFIVFVVSFGIWLTGTIKRNWQELLVFLEEKRRNELSSQLTTEMQEQGKEPVSTLALFNWVFRRYFLSKEVLLAIFFLAIAFDIFLISSTSDLIILFFVLWWLALNLAFKFKSRFSIVVALFFLGLCPFLLILKKDNIAEKAAIWAYMFLVVGTIKMLFEMKKNTEY
ncbi:hypothetical protein KKA69_05945, partial [Patescibacteria group bacterium]|nr:hypothetical protein [Patescibacteria group bacterium]